MARARQRTLMLRLTGTLMGLVPVGVAVRSWAGGPKFVAGESYFDAGVMGQPVHWNGGQVSYFVDQGPLNRSTSNQQATAMVDAAAELWSAVPRWRQER